MDDGDTMLTVEPDGLTGDLRADGDDAPLPDGTWYEADAAGDGLVYDVPDGALSDASYLATEFLIDDRFVAQFQFTLHEGGEHDPTFVLFYGALPQCGGRVRLPLAAVDQGQWQLGREGAWCKPMVAGEPVDPGSVDRIELAVYPAADAPVRWCQTPITVADAAPPLLTDPALPEGPLLDEFGQSTLHEWDGRTEREAELVDRLREQRKRAVADDPGDAVDEWGGWTGREFAATGFFRTEHDGDRWWLVTPDGHPFWSAGLDCVGTNVHTRYDGLADALVWLPDEEGEFADAFDHWGHEGEYVNYGVANLVRAFGPDEWHDAWADLALGQLRRLGFNTVGNWSNWEVARDAGVPYVRPLQLEFEDGPTVFRDFPDVYHEDFPDVAADQAAPLDATVDDPAMVGYFLGNEPTWAFAQQSPAAGMLRTTDTCATRRELADWLAGKYDDDATLADAWEFDVTFDDVATGRWTRSLTEAAREDLQAFSAGMVDRLYGVLSDACREVDPNHLNLGCRFAGTPDPWELAGMHHVDVVTVNCYRQRVPDELGDVADEVDAPVLVGEWHFGALDVGLPSAGIQRVADQEARGDAYRVYLEHAAARPWCVGAHWFTMYDQSALGRFDGENFNVGFFDVCHRPYEPLADAARASHERLYDLATGEVDPYDDEPAYIGRQ